MGNFNKKTQCRNLQVVTNEKNCTLTLWDNAAVYSNLQPGDYIKLYDVKIGQRNGKPTLTARYSDQIEVIINYIFIHTIQIN